MAPSQSDHAYHVIKRDIIRCLLSPGSRTSRSQLADRYGLGRATVRAALDRLVREHLVQVLPREGYRVAPITLGLVRDRLVARLAVESAVARLAAGRLAPAEIDHLFALCDVMPPADAPDRVEAVVAANRAFHLAIAAATGSEKLVEIVANLVDEGERLWFFSLVLLRLDPLAREQREHLAVAQALAAGDAAAAERRMAEHIEASRVFYLDLLLEHPSIQSVALVPLDGRENGAPPSPPLAG